MGATSTTTMNRRFDVTEDKVFDAWMNPESMRKWLFTMDRRIKWKKEPHVGGTWEMVEHRER